LCAQDAQKRGPPLLSRSAQKSFSFNTSRAQLSIGEAGRTGDAMDERVFMSGFFEELKRRKVYRVAIAYIVASWALAQGIAQVFPVFDIPNSRIRVVILLLLIGFPIALVLAWIFDITPSGIERTSRSEAATVPTRRRRRNVVWLGIAGIAISTAVGFLVLPRAVARKVDKSIAVLPFENLSEDKSNAYFTEGVQEEILTRLAKVADLKVIARSSTQKFTSTPENLPDIAKRLGVLNVLEGSVQKVNDQVRVNVQLINAMTNAHLWAETYDRKLTDIFGVESDIAKTIAETLQAKLPGAEESLIAKHPTESTEAHDLYLKGRFFWNKRTPENFEKAITYFQQAIEKDTSYALAYSGMADCYALLANYGAAPPNETMPKAKAAALKALQIDPNLAEAHASLAQILHDYDWDYAGAQREIDRAIQLNPNYATAHQWRAEFLSAQGRHEEALAEAKRALELDPLSIIINRILGDVYLQARRYDEAITQSRKAIEMEPNFPSAHLVLARSYEAKRHYSEAVEEFIKMIEVSGPGARSWGNPNEMHDAYANGGWNGYLRYFIAECRKSETTGGYMRAYPVAVSFAELGEKDEAFAWLEKAYDERDYELTLLKVSPEMDNLRSDPRFTDLLRRVGLAQ
jgi:TolB-like protein/tetratricopeptide (TPR) repeat protein